jgi:hypothetical protein
LHEEGVSLREIAADVGLGMQTVRTLVGKIDGTDRTSRYLRFKRLVREETYKPIKSKGGVRSPLS